MELKRIQYFYIFFAAFLFGSGLAISGMTSPNKILHFLAVGDPDWDPSLAIVLVVAVVIYAVGFAIMKKRKETVFGTPFSPPSHHPITPRLLLGSVIFGLGWGFTGLCPAPAIMRLATLQIEAVIFVAAMLAGFHFGREK